MDCLDAADFAPAAAPPPLRDDIQVWALAGERGDGLPALRRLLAAHLGCAPAAVPIVRDGHGKPQLPAEAALQFNLSHSRGRLLIAIGRVDALGIDLEPLAQRRPFTALARRFFAAPESAALERVPAPRRAEAFLNVWVCKEAVLKAIGHGIAFGLDRLAFDIAEDGTVVRLNVIDASAGGVPEWQIRRLLPWPGYVGALAWRGPPRPVRAFTLA